MAEQTFKSPGFFEREIDLSQTSTSVSGVPAGIAGTSQMGPAFVPVTVGSFIDFENRFGTLDPDMFGPYAVREFLKHRTALTYVRVLGAGANSAGTDFITTQVAGTVKGAGFIIQGADAEAGQGPDGDHSRKLGCVQFISARHYVSASEAVGYPVLTDNISVGLDNNVANLVRAVLMTPTGSRFQVLPFASSSYPVDVFSYLDNNDLAKPSSSGMFKLILSSTAGSTFGSTDGVSGIKIFTASLDPGSDAYISKILNTDPLQFQSTQHLLYADFPVEKEIARVDLGSETRPSWTSGSIALSSGSSLTSSKSGAGSVSFNNLFGKFDSRYTTPTTPFFISQPYGDTEYNLFRVETISDGAWASTKFKISIRDIRKPQSPGQDPYGTFTLEVRDFSDTDRSRSVLERYTGCTLNPASDDYVAKKVGDYKAFYNFDAIDPDERKVVVQGKNPNISSRIRIVTTDELDMGLIPANAIPFGFRGVPVLKTTDTLTDNTGSIRGDVPTPSGPGSCRRLSSNIGGWSTDDGSGPGSATWSQFITSSILPPVPMRFKVTKGVANKSPNFTGEQSDTELVDGNLYWGVKFTRLAQSSSTQTDTIYRTNLSSMPNGLISSYSKLIGILKLDTNVTGSGADKFNNNKFSLSRVAFYNGTGSYTDSVVDSVQSQITGSTVAHMIDAAYIRDGIVDPTLYTIADGSEHNKRLTFASLAALTSSVYFNKFTDFAKFTTFFYGGFDGLNILDPNMANMNDKASSSDTGGYSSGATLDIGLNNEANDFGTGDDNAIIQSYRAAARILTSEVTSRVNIVSIPGIKDSTLTDYVMELLPGYGKAFYVVDLPAYDAEQTRLFRDSSNRPNIDKTSSVFAGRAVDNNYSATYFPDVTITDEINNRPVRVPASVAVIGALAYNDNVSYPWFAPAGFNRASLGFVTNTDVRLNQQDRDTLYENRVNPIASFPGAGFVIFGQKTLQILKSSLDRVNVRRMLLEVKRVVGEVATNIVFEQNTPATRARFVSEVTPLLSNIQIQQGIDQFRIVMDSTNNTDEDIANNILNGRIVIVPTRAVEFIAIDFIITNAGVDFV